MMAAKIVFNLFALMIFKEPHFYFYHSKMCICLYLKDCRLKSSL